MRQQPLTRMEDASCTIQPEAAAAENKRRQEPFPSHDAPSLGQIGREEGGVDSIPSFPTLELCKKVGERVRGKIGQSVVTAAYQKHQIGVQKL